MRAQALMGPSHRSQSQTDVRNFPFVIIRPKHICSYYLDYLSTYCWLADKIADAGAKQIILQK